MSLSVTLDVAIGLIGLYLALSVIASALLEFYRALLSRPAHLLRWGIGELFNDPMREGLAKAFYAHPLIRGLTAGKLPSEIDPKLAARVLVDLMDQGGVLSGASATPVLAPFLREFGADKEKLLQPIADWFKEGVTRLSGIAARRSQAILFAMGVVIAVVFNVDSVEVARALATQEPLRTLAVAEAKHQLERYPHTEPEKSPAGDQAVQDASKNDAAPAAGGAAPMTGGTAPPTDGSAPLAGDAAPATPADAKQSDQNKDATQEAAPAAKAALEPEAARKDLNEKIANLVADYSMLPIGWPDTRCRSLSPEHRPDGTLILPTGCTPKEPPTSRSGGPVGAHWLGWLLTALAISLGSQFWYRLLGQLIKLRGGSSDSEKKGDAKSQS